MSRRLAIAVAIALLGATAAIAGAALYAGGGSPAKRASGACRDWLAASAYHREIAAARELVPK